MTPGRLVVAVLLYCGLLAMTVFMVFPFVWMTLSSFKPLDEIHATGWLPQHPTLDAYARLFSDWHALRAIWNSLWMATVASVVSVFFCALGGYGFAKFRFAGRQLLFNLMIATMALPFVVMMVPLYVFLQNTFNWIDTPWPMIVPGAAHAFGIFFMRQYLISLPDEMLDAARVDGSSELGTFFRIVLPTSVPALATLGILDFIGAWNGFLWAVAILRSPDLQTLPVLMRTIETSTQWGGPPFDLLMAASVVSLVPMLIVFVIGQRYLMEGVTGGAVKG